MFNVNFFFIINVRFFTEYGDIAYFEISDNFLSKKKKEISDNYKFKKRQNKPLYI